MLTLPQLNDLNTSGHRWVVTNDADKGCVTCIYCLKMLDLRHATATVRHLSCSKQYKEPAGYYVSGVYLGINCLGQEWEGGGYRRIRVNENRPTPPKYVFGPYDKHFRYTHIAIYVQHSYGPGVENAVQIYEAFRNPQPTMKGDRLTIDNVEPIFTMISAALGALAMRA